MKNVNNNLNQLNKKKLLYLIPFILLVLLAIFFILTFPTKKTISEIPQTKTKKISHFEQKKVETEAQLIINFNKTDIRAGDEFEMNIYVESDNQPIDGVEYQINYDPKLISVSEDEIGSFFALYPQNVIDSNEGKLRVIALHDVNETKKLTKELIISYKVTAKKKGNVEFDFDKKKTHIAAFGGQDLLKNHNNVKIKIQ